MKNVECRIRRKTPCGVLENERMKKLKNPDKKTP